MKIKLEKSQYHRFSLYYDYSIDRVNFCKSLKESFGWKEFSFESSGELKRWVFSNSLLIPVIQERFPEVDIDIDAEDLVKKEQRWANEVKKKNEIIDIVKEKTDTDFHVKGLKKSLYTYQRVGVEFLVASKGRAIIMDPPGLGKTAQALAFIKHSGFKRVLVVCPASVKFSWALEVKKWTGLSSVVIDGKTKIHEITADTNIWIINYDLLRKHHPQLSKIRFCSIIGDEIHMCKNIQTIRTKIFRQLSRNIKSIVLLSGTPLLSRPIELFSLLNILDMKTWNNYYDFGRKYCLPGDAPVLMGDLTEKKIKDIQKGEKIIGWNHKNGKNRRLVVAVVNDVLKRKSEIQEVSFSDGTKAVCTPDHKWAIATPYKKNGIPFEYQVARAGTTSVGPKAYSRHVSIMRSPNPIYSGDDYKLGYIYGAFAGDGWCQKNINSKFYFFRKKTTKGVAAHIVGIAVKDKEIIDRISLFLSHFNVKHYINPRSDGLFAINGLGNEEGYNFIRSCKKKSKEWYAGFLGGIYDTEGCGQIISQYLFCNPITSRLIKRALNIFGFKYSIVNHKTKGEYGVRILGGRVSLLKLWSIGDPSLKRKLLGYVLNGGGRFANGGLNTNKSYPHVMSIKKIHGVHDVYTLTTSTGNYVAYGLGSKNCDAKQTRWGLDVSGTSNAEELHARIYNMFLRRRKEDVLKELPPKIYFDIPIELDKETSNEYNMAEKNLALYLKTYSGKQPKEIAKSINAEKLTQLGALRMIATRGKISSAIELAESIIESGEKLLIFSSFNEPLEKLSEHFGDKAVMITGKTPVGDRGDIVNSFQNDERKRVFLGGFLSAGSGITLTAASSVILINLPWNPADMAQAIDRAHRIGSRHESINVFKLNAMNTVDSDIQKLLEEKQNVFD
ncbi:MAG: SNF2-related protein, partial [Candidatus Roizmanbacteria bacterium]|nr:SNF2-related protein [Candidatus Roizmanbacteria bacterium]